MIFLFGFSTKRNEVKKANKINIYFTNGDNLFITYEMVNKLLIQNYLQLKSQSKENILLNKLEELLLSNEMIENAEVYREVNGNIGAIITQKTPIGRVCEKNNRYYIDRMGKKMPLSFNYSARVPIVEGVIDGKISKDVFTLLKLVYEDGFLNKQIVGIKLMPENEFILKTRVGDQTIEFGNLNRLNNKVKKLKTFYHKILKDNTLGEYKNISLIYENQVICTKI
jgi:cell division protein FtsQ